MQPTVGLWEALRKKLLRFTSTPGSKSELARMMRVSQSAVSQWLDPSEKGTRPTAETTLQLLKWAEDYEAKEKSRASANDAGAGKKAQRKNRYAAKPSSGHKRE